MKSFFVLVAVLSLLTPAPVVGSATTDGFCDLFPFMCGTVAPARL